MKHPERWAVSMEPLGEKFKDYPYFDGIYRSKKGKHGLEPSRRIEKFPCKVKAGETLWWVQAKEKPSHKVIHGANA